MRERSGSVITTILAKIHRDGLLAAVQAAPAWILTTTVREAMLELGRRQRRIRYHRRGYAAIPDATATIDIDPATVTHRVPGSRFGDTNIQQLLGTIRGGNWDIGLPRIESQMKYQVCRLRVEGVPWAETGIVDHLVAELEATETSTIEHGCDSRAALLERYETTRERLYRTLRDSGYDRSVSPVCCRVHVGRDGALLLGDGGHHRFYLSRLLGIDSVPVQVLCRHRAWQAIREVVAMADTTHDIPPGLRMYRDHPDLRLLWPSRTPTSKTGPTRT